MHGIVSSLLVASIVLASWSCGGKELTVGDTGVADSSDSAWDADHDSIPPDTAPIDTASDDGAPVDTLPDTADDAAGDCPAWRLVGVPAAEISRVDKQLASEV